MKKIFIFTCFSFLFFFVSVAHAQAALIISEFSPATTTEWVEVLNMDNTSSVDVSDWTITESSTSNSVTLSGTVPRQGFLTFEFSAGSLPDAGGQLVLANDSGVTQYTVSYGNYTPQASNHVSSAPTSTQSGAFNPDADTWGVSSDPTKGWCGTGYGTCPTVSTITQQMSNEGVNTNLGSQEDLSRITGLWFEDPNHGKIQFAAELNFTDQDAMTWIQNLGDNITMSGATIGLDADLIVNLVSTQATLSMYNLNFTDPTVQVTNTDGTAGDSSIVSGLSYNSSTGTLTFTAAHFTTFTAVESATTSTVSASIAGPPGCFDLSPSNAPHLFQIDTTTNSATLYFTPVTNNLSYYFIAYGYSQGDQRFGTQVFSTLTDGVIEHTIYDLAPNTSYYFQVRGGNGCAPGNWSNWLMAKTEGGASGQVQGASVSPEEVKAEMEGRLDTESEDKIEKKIETEEATAEGSVAEAVFEFTPTSRPTINLEEVNRSPTVSRPKSEKLNFWQKIINFFRSLFGLK